MATSAKQRIEQHLASCGIQWAEAAGYFKGVIDVADGRTQVFMVDFDADELGPYQDFDILSPVCRIADQEARVKQIAYPLLEFSGKQKFGHVAVFQGMLVYKADCPIDAPTAVFQTVLQTVCKTADVLEKIVTDGADAF
jgi:hypothetical protein